MNKPAEKKLKAKLLLVAAFLCVPLFSGLGAVIGNTPGLIGGYMFGQAILIPALMKYRSIPRVENGR